jgi:hypothetical protein
LGGESEREAGGALAFSFTYLAQQRCVAR